MITIFILILGLIVGYALRARTSISMKTFKEQADYCSRAISEKHNINELFIGMTRSRDELEKNNLTIKNQNEELLKANNLLFKENEKVTAQINRMMMNSESLEKSLPVKKTMGKKTKL